VLHKALGGVLYFRPPQEKKYVTINGFMFVKSEPEARDFNVSRSFWLAIAKLYVHFKTSALAVTCSVICILTESLTFPIQVGVLFCCLFYNFKYDSIIIRLMITMLDVLKIFEVSVVIEAFISYFGSYSSLPRGRIGRIVS
jgi:hypothetical protein